MELTKKKKRTTGPRHLEENTGERGDQRASSSNPSPAVTQRPAKNCEEVKKKAWQGRVRGRKETDGGTKNRRGNLAAKKAGERVKKKAVVEEWGWVGKTRHTEKKKRANGPVEYHTQTKGRTLKKKTINPDQGKKTKVRRAVRNRREGKSRRGQVSPGCPANTVKRVC